MLPPTISSKWITEQIVYLSSQLGVYKLESGENFFFEPTGGFYGFIAQGQIGPLNEAMRMLGEHILAKTVPIIEDWEGSKDWLTTSDHDFTSDKDPPGLITYNGPYHSRIKIGFPYKHSPFLLGAILAHELTHHFLFNQGIVLPDIDENERFTDLAAVFLGLGKLILNGYEPINWTINRLGGHVKYTERIGYLCNYDIARIIRHICVFRQISFQAIQNNLTDRSSQLIIQAYYNIGYDKLHKNILDGFANFIESIFPYFFNKIAGKKKTTDHTKLSTDFTIIIACILCKQKMRIPVVDCAIKVKCPACHNKFIIKPKALIYNEN